MEIREVKQKEVTIVEEPTIFVMADMGLRHDALDNLVKWLEKSAPQCLGLEEQGTFSQVFPHEDHEDSGDPNLPARELTDNELLVELAGRKCYNSFGQKAGRKSNAEYIANLFGAPGKIPHASVLYHAKMTFFFGGLSRRVSHELIRNYVGSDRSEEGSPSQESTRFTHHPGHFVIHPRDLEDHDERQHFRADMQRVYNIYQAYLERQLAGHREAHGAEPTGMARKRIYEAAAGRLTGAAATSFFWTTNPEALSKLLRERTDDASDLEIQRFARKLQKICAEEWPNLFRFSNRVYGNQL